ncbi:hypothetical protein M8C21_024567 [Ambrosia artemisiifolia]|uniref:non-specific serine/threonine protein kinase n=1 Tax=Ambrosia artemisiifolia TaxID=4212 RepID=A0AAD5BT80_AMBAR|nr:hypothetical protein M8C21_024567 [Ambrosia artemisiifolia]
MLNFLSLHKNIDLEGGIPTFIANLTLLDTLSLGHCQLGGRFPDVFHQLTKLRRLAFSGNNLVGTIPTSFYNCSSLELAYLFDNRLTGRLPSNLTSTMPRLAALSLSVNQLTGPLPPSLLGSPQLNILEAEDNYLSGKLVITPRNSCNLEFLFLSGNSFESEKDDEMKLIDDLSFCRKLRKIYLSYNQFKGFLPESLGNLSTTLQIMSIASNHIFGGLPSSIGNLIGLTDLDMSSNQFTGTLPVTIGNLTNLHRLNLMNNSFSGSIPSSLGNLSLLLELYLTSNEFTGTIPSSLGNCKNLIRLNLEQNNLTGDIPRQLFEISSLSISLNLGNNQLSGQLPIEVGNLKNLNEIILSNNRLSGDIPSSLGSCSSLQNLDISYNLFSGSFPSSLGTLRALEYLDASQNNFTGEIPTYLEVIPLKNLNISFNNLAGEVPRKGVFANASSISILGNSQLCGGMPELQLPKCRSNKKKNKLSLAVILVISLGSVLLFVVLVLFFACYPRKKKVEDGPQKTASWDYLSQVSYNMLYNATDGFSTENLIGEGSFSSVYKGCLDIDGVNIVAIKVLNLHHRSGFKSFISECDALRNTRHINLAKVITCCSGINFQDMVAHLGDFGLSKILQSEYQHRYNNSSAGVRGTIGYAAPEYGVGSKVSKNADMYSYGIMLLEMMTRKKPTDVMFGEELSLHSYAENAMGDGALKIVDPVLLKDDQKIGLTTNKKETTGYLNHGRCLHLLLEIGVSCSMESPQNRMDIASVIQQLRLIKNAILGNSTV